MIGIFGAGKVGTALARLLVASGYEVLMTGSPRQTALDLLVGVVAPGARVVQPDELVARADIIIVAVPFGKAPTVPWHRFDDRIVVDAMNYWPPVDGNIAEVDADPRTTSERTPPATPSPASSSRSTTSATTRWRTTAWPPGRRCAAPSPSSARTPMRVPRWPPSSTTSDSTRSTAASLANGQALQPGHPAFGRELSAAELTALLTPAAHLAA